MATRRGSKSSQARATMAAFAGWATEQKRLNHLKPLGVLCWLTKKNVDLTWSNMFQPSRNKNFVESQANNSNQDHHLIVQANKHRFFPMGLSRNLGISMDFDQQGSRGITYQLPKNFMGMSLCTHTYTYVRTHTYVHIRTHTVS